MADIVFLLGAGASRAGGAPLMADFLDTADQLWKVGEVTEHAADFDRVFKLIAHLQQIHSKSELDLYNIESIFAVLEMARTLRTLPGATPEGIEPAIASLKVLIVRTLEQTLRFVVSRESVASPQPYDHFAGLLRHLRDEARPRQSVAVLTFNYDIAADFALHFAQLGPSYCLASEKEKLGRVPLLKLHGSLNWAECPACEQVVAWPIHQFMAQMDWYHGGSVAVRIGSFLEAFKHCPDRGVKPEPIIVPPTWNKGGYHQAIASVWQAAAAHLSEASSIFVIGYSLPTSDAFFRYLYALGTFGPQLLKRFWVFNPDDSGNVETRFRELLGPAARDRFAYISGLAGRFDKAIPYIRHTFGGR